MYNYYYLFMKFINVHSIANNVTNMYKIAHKLINLLLET